METTTSISTLPPPDPTRSRRAPLKFITLALVLGLIVWSWIGVGVSAGDLKGSGARIAELADRMFPPDLTWNASGDRLFAPPLRLAAGVVAITLQISILGTALGMLAALALGFLGAESLTPHWVHHPIKVFLALLRSIPVLLLAILFVAALGLGPLPGVLAIAIHSVGMLGKLFAEECEKVDPGVWEAMDSAGSNWFQKVRYAVWPQVASPVLSLTLFRLDMNLRESAVLGIVGVAGLGLWIENYRRAFDYPAMTTLVLVTMLLVLAVDQLSNHIRRKLK